MNNLHRTGAFALVGILLSGCGGQSPGAIVASLQANSKADQDAVLALAKSAEDKPLAQCAQALSNIADVQCPTYTDPVTKQSVAGPACLAAKAYLTTKAVGGDCAALAASAKQAGVGLAAGFAALFP
jgi:hypothetical protein